MLPQLLKLLSGTPYRRFLPGLAVILSGLSLFCVVARVAWHREHAALQADFDAAADNRVCALRREVDGHLTLMTALARAMADAGDSERRHLLAAAAMQTIQHSIRWVPRIPASRREVFERQLRREYGIKTGIRDLVRRNFQPSPARPAHFPVASVAPNARDQQELLGLDVASRPDLVAVMDEAQRTGRPAATRGTMLMQRNGLELGVVTFFPVFREPGKRLLGFVQTVVYPSDLLEHGLRTLRPHGVHVEIRDGTAPQELLYRHESRKKGTSKPDLRPYQATLDVGGRQWCVRCVASSGGGTVAGIYPWLVLGGGGLISLLLGAYINTNAARAMRVEKEVEERTLALKESTCRLEAEVHERRAAEQALSKARDEALASSRLKSQFLANVSHEIRTPINGILGTLGMLSESGLDARQGEFVLMLRHSATALRHVIDDILDMSRIEAGTLVLRKESFRIADVADEALTVISHDAIGKGLWVRADFQPGVPASVLGDASRLRQVLLNLLGNAIKFTNSGGVHLRVSSKSTDAGVVRFEVCDTGIGIAEADHQLIFRRFVQVDGGNTRRRGGAGLGLAISKHLVELMGGEIGLESQPGKGSLFWFELPLPPPPPAEAPTEPVEEVRHGPPGKFGILLVEDNMVNRTVALWQLKKLGYEVECATNGREALRALERGRYSAVLMDCQMPEMDGFETTAWIRRQNVWYREIPIIALTANAMTGDRERCLAAGMNDYVAKPIESAALARVLDKWVRATGTEPPLAEACRV